MAKIRAQPNTGFDKIVDGVVANIQRPQKKLIQIDTAETKKIVWYVCQKKAQLLNREFALTDFNKNLLKELTLYFSNDPSCVYDLQKGLLFMGGVGLGKTFLMDVFRTIASQTKVKSFRMVTTHDVYDSIALSKTDNQLSNIEQYYRGHYCFDDLGHEPTTFKHYGNDIALMEKIITERYKRFVNGYCLTHMVTNLDFEMINDRYGLRVYDRIRQMFNLVLFDGESMR